RPRSACPPCLPPLPTRRSSDLHGVAAALRRVFPILRGAPEPLGELVRAAVGQVRHPPGDAQPDVRAPPGRRVVVVAAAPVRVAPDRKSTRLNSSHQIISYAVFC